MSKRFGLILVALLIVPMLLTACGSESRDVAQDFVKAMLNGDADKAQDLACESYQATAAALAEDFGTLDINNLDLKYDVGKGGNQEEIIVTGSFDIGRGDDADEVELANSVRLDDNDDEMVDTRLVLDMKEDGDWCVNQVNQGGKALGAASTEEVAPVETEEAPVATEEAAPVETEEAAPVETEEAPVATEEATEEAS
jgi:hypothetical protein